MKNIQYIFTSLLCVTLTTSSALACPCDKEDKSKCCKKITAEKDTAQNKESRAQPNLQMESNSESKNVDLGRHGRGAMARERILK